MFSLIEKIGKYNASETGWSPVFAVTIAFITLFAVVQPSPVEGQPKGAELEAGSSLPTRAFRDQWNNAKRIQGWHKYILFSAEKEVSDQLHSIISPRGGIFLDREGIFYIGDIHKMPTAITNLIALPRMQTYSYSIHLLKTAAQGKMFPRRKGHATLIKIKDGRVESIRYILPKNLPGEVN